MVEQFLSVKYQELEYAKANGHKVLYDVVLSCINRVKQSHLYKAPVGTQLTLF